MRFKQFMEAGHTSIETIGPLPVLFQGQEVDLEDIMYIDPRFEYMNIPPAEETLAKNPKVPKFLGELDFSLPLANGFWIVSKREGMMSGSATIQREPQGVIVPDNWADYADFMSKDGRVSPKEMLIAQ